MKKLVLLMVIMSTLLAACSKTARESVTYKGVVIYDICGNIVIQSLGPDYIGQETWVDVNNTERPVYKHVFRVANPCQFREHSYGDTINFQVVAPQVQHCTTCQAYLVTPDTAYPIHVDE